MTTPRQWNCFKTAAIAISLVIAAMAVTTQAQEATLKLEKGDRICILGNTFADRMQHFGWFETLLQARFPKHELYIRNLGFSGDTLTTRLRSLNFGTPESHLKANRANVVFLMFGYNESYAGKEGLEKFKADLAAEIRKHAAQKYDGEHNARVVVVSPIAHERLDDPNLPDPRENNRRLEMYTQAMQDVSRELNTPFVDLFHATQALYQQSDQPLTRLPGGRAGRRRRGATKSCQTVLNTWRSVSEISRGLTGADVGLQTRASVGNVVDPGAAPGVAAADAFDSQPAAPDGTEAVDGFQRIFRAGGRETALPPDEVTECRPVEPDQPLGQQTQRVPPGRGGWSFARIDRGGFMLMRAVTAHFLFSRRVGGQGVGGLDDRIEGQHDRGMAGLVGAGRFQNLQFRPGACGDGAVRFQHSLHFVADPAHGGDVLADHGVGDNGGG